MAYVTGSVNNITDLMSAIRNACIANGWTLSGEVLHKGTAYFRTQVVSGALTILGGTGKDGGNVLTGDASQVSRIADFAAPAALAYPMTYHIHINTSPDEVYVVVNHSSDYFQYMAFGQSDIPTAGTGNWFGASAGPTSSGGICIGHNTGGVFTNGRPPGALFWVGASFQAATVTTGFVHHGLEGGSGWSGVDTLATLGGKATAIVGISPLMGISPNTYNGEAILLPIPVLVGRASGRVSLVAQMKHARYVRIDNFSPGQVIAIGPDQWKIYPWFKKDVANRNGSVSEIFHSGTFGWAIRYTP